MIKLTIDGRELEVQEGLTILQACEVAGVQIPRFCYHERLKIAGNCRMCLVDMEKSPKPVASCAMTVANGTVIHTNTPKVEQIRQEVMELLLINHPLDCPICDQGGECDLQDQAYRYGRNKGRFHENKRAVKDKYMGPLIKTHMTRCIHCTRCIRFMADIAGVEEIGVINRGEHSEITTYLEQAISSELSGNLIDVCPVGALTSKPYAYHARSWELSKTESVDVFDAMGCNIRVDSRGMTVMRILPKNNDDINEEWISDKARFACDGLRNQRLDVAYVRRQGKLVPTSVQEAIGVVAEQMKLHAPDIGVIAGPMVDCESLFMAKTLFNGLGSEYHDANVKGLYLNRLAPGNYLFNTTFAGLDIADLVMLFGTNVRHTAPVLNARIGRRVRQEGLRVAHIGVPSDQTYHIQELGNETQIIDELLSGKHPFSQALKSATKPVFIVGQGVLGHKSASDLVGQIHELAMSINGIRQDWNCYNILHDQASLTGALHLGFVSEQIAAAQMPKRLKLVYLLGVDNIPLEDKEAFVVYQGHHGDYSARFADVILPGAAYTEKDATYINIEGRAQHAFKAVKPPHEAMEDWALLRDLIAQCLPGHELSTLQSVYDLRRLNAFTALKLFLLFSCKKELNMLKPVQKTVIKSRLDPVNINFYMSDPISRASPTMAEILSCKQN